MSGYLSGRTSLTTVQTADIAADAVTAAKIPAGAIGSSEIAADAVGASEIAANAVGASEIAANAVDASEITALTGALDINGQELILDADADTSITADTDDQIDIKIAGADDFRFTANNFNVLSGSTLTIDSGATITNSGTATNFGTDSESAYAGILQANANFVDQVIFGPSVDGMPWKGLWNKASVFSSLMLATIEDEGSNTEINIWDLTEQTSGAISTTPLATVDLTNDATPTSIAASMGYLIIGSEDGISIVDPHSGVWAERLTGWPRNLTTSTTPALNDNSVIAVAAGLSNQPAFDPRTGGPLPSFGAKYGSGNRTASVIKDDGNVWEFMDSSSGAEKGIGIAYGRIIANYSATDLRQMPIHLIIADDTVNPPYQFADAGGNEPRNLAAGIDAFSAAGNLAALGAPEGLGLVKGFTSDAPGISVGSKQTLNAGITRAYNTGYTAYWPKGTWLANSKTVDRSAYANTLTENGTVTEAAVESGAELLGYSGFSSSNNFSRAYDTDFEFGTGDFHMSCWVKSSNVTSTECLMMKGTSGGTYGYRIRFESTGTFGFYVTDSGSSAFNSTQIYDDAVWHKVDQVRDGNTHYGYVDGVLKGTSDVTSDNTNNGSTTFGIGYHPGDTAAATSSTISLARLSASAPSATRIRQAYDAEKGMFVASAECLLQSGTTDAVVDVSVDPLGSGKVLVTQTDAITIFDGLVVDSKPTVNSGASEKGKLWGDLRAEQNAANAYVTAPAVDQRQVNEMVRGLASELPAGVDLSKAKAWVYFENCATISASYNIKALTNHGTGNLSVDFAVPFKSANYVAVSMAANRAGSSGGAVMKTTSDTKGQTASNFGFGWTYFNDSYANEDGYIAFFGELENE
jgi:hypothetical protein